MSQASQSILITNAFSNIASATNQQKKLLVKDKGQSNNTNDSGKTFSQKLTDAKELSKPSQTNASTNKQQQTTRTSRLDAKPLKSESSDKKLDSKNNQVQKDDPKSASKVKDKGQSDIKNDGNVMDAVKTESKQPVKAKEEVKEAVSEEQELDEVDEKVLALVSQALNIPIETIQAKLTELGMQAKDLMTEDGFGQFINEMLGQGNAEYLLSGDIDIKGITKLFEGLVDLKQQYKELLEEKVGDGKFLTETLTQNGTSQNTVETPQTVSENVGVVHAEVLSEQNEQVHEEQLQTQVDVTSSEEGQGQTEGLGLTVPIQHFTSNTFSQTFNMEAGVMAQTVTTKQAMNGKAFIEQIDFKVIAQTKEINVSLSPKELGNMNIKIVENNGAMVAEIKVDNDKAKELIQNEIHALKESLSEQGLNVTNVKVDIRQGNGQSQMEQERQKSSKRIQEIIANQLNEEASVEEEQSPQVASESEVDYMV